MGYNNKMSGHSAWKNIKYKKEAADAKRSKAFSKISREITIAAREGGKDPDFNPRLRMAIERAKDFNMPAENIEKAIKRGTGELEGAKLESIIIEAYGPGGVAIIIEGITDNKNRSLEEIRQILIQNGAKMVTEGAVRWMFERKIGPGILEWVPKQTIEATEKDREACQKLFSALDENEAVQEIYSNLKTTNNN
jgi:YebC/PmpR family DNA-binding regulatory protein